jgi:hypothetical protein
MGLPARQQRVLESIGETLQLTEPRLTAMFAIFARLTRNEPTPAREQLVRTAIVTRLAAVVRRLPGSPRPAHRGHRAGRARAERGRMSWQRVLIISQMAIAVIVLAVLIGIGSHDIGSRDTVACRTGQRPPAASSLVSRPRACPAAGGSAAIPAGK